MTDPSLEPIFAYLRENAGRYSLGALREQLLQSGYDPAAVDRAIAIHQQDHPPRVPAPVWPKALQVVAANAVLTAVAIGLGASGLNDTVMSALGGVLFLLGCAELLGGIGLVVPEKTRPWGLGLLFGFFLSIGLGILVLGGVCIYFLSQGNFH